MASLQSNKRLIVRKARGLQTEEIGCKCQTFFIFVLSRRRKQAISISFFSLLHTKFKGGFFLFSFFKISVLFIYLFFTLQYCISFAIHWHESTMSVHEFPNMKPPSHLPPHIISLDHPHAPAPSTLYHALNLDWWFFPHLIMPFSHIIPPSPSPTESKVCSLHLCLFCCLAYRVIKFLSYHLLKRLSFSQCIS